MKRTLIIMLVLVFSVSIGALAAAKTPDGETPAVETVCDDAGLTGEAWDLCNAYCEAQDCDVNDRPSCKVLKRNYEKVTGVAWLPCDIIACGKCADPDPDNMTGTVGVCVDDEPAINCVEPELAIGEYSCDVVTLPADIAPGCSEIPPQWGLIPDCQYTGPAWVCSVFIGGVSVDKCPAPPSCCPGDYYWCE